MYKAITFFDLDNTLLNEFTQVDTEVAQAMDQLRQNNILPVIATGRNIFEITKILEDTKIDTVVSANGDYVIYEGKPVYKSEMSKEVISDLANYAKSFGDSIAVLNDKDSKINFNTDFTKGAYDSVNSIVPALGAKEFAENNPIYMMIVLTVGHDEDYLNRFKDTLTFYRNTPFSMDVINTGNSKQHGIEELIKNANLQGIPTYAFGDGNNDVSMINFADYGISMGNGLPHVKEIADYVTTNNTDHGIVNGLKHYGLI
ncbi:Cof-type HAD-IIB family hydrolase [Lentilactobacillus laojiaonis]|uniref:Cof-type HAD-IIB family hydrolase n=1 Tax=Lentilactobacillus laojiaonis TaxID=2883998 RepID=UPI001D0A8433|nr:Cof-type HAD-IIB family hydrolase [Lentilactobacillus laojiaonis]UDM31781.1 Cof-type HAD-IIB family hydrolase [Lentilactobacillus laojiaonis]